MQHLMGERPNLSRHVFIFHLQNIAGLLQTLFVGVSGKVKEKILSWTVREQLHHSVMKSYTDLSVTQILLCNSKCRDERHQQSQTPNDKNFLANLLKDQAHFPQPWTPKSSLFPSMDLSHALRLPAFKTIFTWEEKGFVTHMLFL